MYEIGDIIVVIDDVFSVPNKTYCGTMRAMAKANGLTLEVVDRLKSRLADDTLYRLCGDGWYSDWWFREEMIAGLATGDTADRNYFAELDNKEEQF